MLDVGSSKRKDPDGECSVILWKYWRLGMWLSQSREQGGGDDGGDSSPGVPVSGAIIRLLLMLRAGEGLLQGLEHR